jgi:hypothetical protein
LALELALEKFVLLFKTRKVSGEADTARKGVVKVFLNRRALEDAVAGIVANAARNVVEVALEEGEALLGVAKAAVLKYFILFTSEKLLRYFDLPLKRLFLALLSFLNVRRTNKINQ